MSVQDSFRTEEPFARKRRARTDVDGRGMRKNGIRGQWEGLELLESEAVRAW